jgi:sRNA-binding regulator protein Hfq
MDKKYLEKYFLENIKIKINLKNGYFYNGHIISLENTTLIFKDKFGNEIPMDLDSISYINEEKNNVN